MADEAFRLFGDVPPGWARVQAVSDWANGHLGFQYGSSSPSYSARDVFDRGLGVCRDFAHLAITMCRALNIPARYVFGYLPDIGVPDPGTPMDFCAWMEVFLGDSLAHVRPAQQRAADRAHGDRPRPRRRRRGDGHVVRRGRSSRRWRSRPNRRRPRRDRDRPAAPRGAPRRPAARRRRSLLSAKAALYVLDQEVAYDYSAPIADVRQRLMIVPRPRHGDQSRVAHRLDVAADDRRARRRAPAGRPLRQRRRPRRRRPGDRSRCSFGLRAVVRRDLTAAPVHDWPDAASAASPG